MNTLSVPILENLHYIGVNDRDTRLFENMWPLEDGVSYNSYLLTGEKTALLDTVKITKVDHFLDKIREVLGDRPLDYLVVHHMEPDHSGSIRAVIDAYPGITIVGNKKTAEFLNNFYRVTDRIKIVADKETLDLGTHRLTFYTTPMVHWPESMVSFEETTGTLFSQDAFGGFGALNGPIFDDEINWEYYAGETRRYFTNIVGKFSKQVQAALKKLQGLDIKMICPVHGPIWRENPGKIIDLYDRLSRYESEEGVVIVYGSMYGNTEVMAETIARTLAEEGVKNIRIYDVSKTHNSYILSDIWLYRGLILGSCTYNNFLFPLMHNLLNVIKMNRLQNHILGMFGSYSWSGGALKALKEFGDSCDYDVIETTAEAKGAPTKEDLELCRQIAVEMANKLKAVRE